jgi:uncharacterized protein (TIGR00255 family)
MAIQGMTGFGRHEASLGAWSWAIEARSVNGRNLEVRFRGPPGFDGLERAAREAAAKRFQRGQLTLSLQAKRREAGGLVQVNGEQLARYLALIGPLVAQGKAGLPSADGLLALRGVLEISEETDDPQIKAQSGAAMATSIEHAMDALLGARLEEGAALMPVLLGLVDQIDALIAQAEHQAQQQPGLIKARFAKRLTELAGNGPDLADRILTEAAAMAVKADVREELDRLVNHIKAARSLLSGEVAAGRRLDFLMQEFMREANTLCAKSALTALTTIGLELKALIEQLREQVQNVE